MKEYRSCRKMDTDKTPYAGRHEREHREEDEKRCQYDSNANKHAMCANVHVLVFHYIYISGCPVMGWRPLAMRAIRDG